MIDDILILLSLLCCLVIFIMFMASIVDALSKILVEVRLIRFLLNRPGLVKLVLEKEKFDMATSIFDVKLTLPGVSAPDVTKRVLQYSLDGSAAVPVDLGPGETEYMLLDVPQDTTITGSLVDVDESGNQSQPSEFSLVVSDTQAPPQPGQVGLTLGEERFAATPAPIPVPEPVTEPEVEQE